MATVRDPIAALAITMQARKGTFALLLGSGVSRSAQIPTGWEIVRQLIERLAAANGEAIEGEPEDWYLQTRGKEVSYSDLLDELAPRQPERSLVIRPFIEPTLEEAENGLKQPTAAHLAIARLVAHGYIRVIVTTNFDKLLEAALAVENIVPSVISTADGVEKSFPLVHSTCTILKVHGDYMDANIRNTIEELSQYDERMDQLLKQVFREYGLIVSGWSADWDVALREILCEDNSPWFSTYWIANSQANGKASEVICARNGQVVTQMAADDFFIRLNESVQSVQDLTVPELVSVSIAVATLKRHIDDPTKRTRVFDLLNEETQRVRNSEIIDVPDDYLFVEPTKELIEERLDRMESATSILRAMLTTIGYWGSVDNAKTVLTCVEKLGGMPSVSGQYYESWK